MLKTGLENKIRSKLLPQSRGSVGIFFCDFAFALNLKNICANLFSVRRSIINCLCYFNNRREHLFDYNKIAGKANQLTLTTFINLKESAYSIRSLIYFNVTWKALIKISSYW